MFGVLEACRCNRQTQQSCPTFRPGRIRLTYEVWSHALGTISIALKWIQSGREHRVQCLPYGIGPYVGAFRAVTFSRSIIPCQELRYRCGHVTSSANFWKWAPLQDHVRINDEHEQLHVVFCKFDRAPKSHDYLQKGEIAACITHANALAYARVLNVILPAVQRTSNNMVVLGIR